MNKKILLGVIPLALILLVAKVLADDANDSDRDGLPDCMDMCPGTHQDYVRLQTNRWMWNGTAWVTKLPKGRGPKISFTLQDTRGCSCHQILDWLHRNHPEEFGLMKGHWKYGCSISIMEEFIERQQCS